MDMGDPIRIVGSAGQGDMNTSDHAKGDALHWHRTENGGVAVLVLVFMLFLFALGLRGGQHNNNSIGRFNSEQGGWELECALHHLAEDDVKQKIG